MSFVFAPHAVTSLAIVGSEKRFPVRRVFCVGRNYEAHAREMGKDPNREPPFFFTKPADAVVAEPKSIPYPPLTSNLHYEIELVVAIGRDGFDIPAEKALDHVFGYAVGVDLTRRDLQSAAKDLGRPWDWGKAFDASAPMSAIKPAVDIGHPHKGRIWLKVNGALKQEGDIGDLIWNVQEVIASASRSIRLKAGDIIMTGTPAGVGPIVVGDRIDGGVDGVGEIAFAMSAPEK